MKRRRILIAEDDANIRNGLCDALESEGYEVCGAADGKPLPARAASISCCSTS